MARIDRKCQIDKLQGFDKNCRFLQDWWYGLWVSGKNLSTTLATDQWSDPSPPSPHLTGFPKSVSLWWILAFIPLHQPWQRHTVRHSAGFLRILHFHWPCGFKKWSKMDGFSVYRPIQKTRSLWPNVDNISVRASKRYRLTIIAYRKLVLSINYS